MRHTITYLLLVLGIAYPYAQPTDTRDAQAQQGFQSQQIYSSGSSYNGTIYEPFGTSVPSEQSEVGASYSPAKAPGRPRKSFNTGAEYGRDEAYPLGEPWILLLFAAIFAAAITARKERQ